jgi:hypothetical protein
MPEPASGPKRHRTNWLLTGFEAGIVLSLAGILFLHLNPFWNANEAGSVDASSVHTWNLAAGSLTAIGLSLFSLALVGAVAALVSRCFASRPVWPYLVAVVAVGGILSWLGFVGFTRDFDARFEWNSGDGFKVFALQGPGPAPSLPAANWIWTSLIAMQVQPQLQGYFHVIDWHRANGRIGVEVVRIIPIAWPTDLEKVGDLLEDPDETPLMQAAEKGDLPAVQQLLAAKPDVNARDQGGQTALIHACLNPQASPEMIKLLLAAGADPNIRSRNDYTALAWATSRGNKPVIQLLRHAGAKP